MPGRSGKVPNTRPPSRARKNSNRIKGRSSTPNVAWRNPSGSVSEPGQAAGPLSGPDAGTPRSDQFGQHDRDVVLQCPAPEPGSADERGARRIERPDKERRLGYPGAIHALPQAVCRHEERPPAEARLERSGLCSAPAQEGLAGLPGREAPRGGVAAEYPGFAVSDAGP